MNRISTSLLLSYSLSLTLTHSLTHSIISHNRRGAALHCINLQVILDDYFNKVVDFATCGSAALNASVNASFSAGPGLNEHGIDTIQAGVVGQLQLSNLDLVKNISLFGSDPSDPYVLKQLNERASGTKLVAVLMS